MYTVSQRRSSGGDVSVSSVHSTRTSASTASRAAPSRGGGGGMTPRSQYQQRGRSYSVSGGAGGKQMSASPPANNRNHHRTPSQMGSVRNTKIPNNHNNNIEMASTAGGPSMMGTVTQAGLGDHSGIMAPHDEALQHDLAHAATLKKRRSRCTVPLMALLFFQCLAVIGSFVAIIVVSNVVTKRTSENLIRSAIISDLQYAGSQIASPINTAENVVRQFRDRYNAYTLFNGKQSCSDEKGGFAASSGFYADTALVISNNPIIYNMFLVGKPYVDPTFANIRRNFSGSSTNTNGRDFSSLSQCSASQTHLFRRFNGTAMTSSRIPRVMDFFDLDTTLSLDTLSDYSYLNSHTNAAMGVEKLTWIPHMSPTTLAVKQVIKLARNVAGGTMTTEEYELAKAAVMEDPSMKATAIDLFLICAAPMAFNVSLYSLATGLFVNTTTIPFYDAEVMGVGSSGTDFAPLIDAAKRNGYRLEVETIATMAATIQMQNYAAVMTSINQFGDSPLGDSTDSLRGVGFPASTTIYDLNQQTMLGSSFVHPDLQFDTANGKLYTAGNTPWGNLNRAFINSKTADLKESGDVNVFFNEAFIVSSYLFATAQSGVRFAVVQSTPRDQYFHEVDRLQTIMIALGVCCAFVVLLCCAFMNIVIKIGVNAILVNMSFAAVLKNDRAKYVTSFLYEVAQLSDGFDAMNNKLLEARAYLPQHMLMTSSSEDDDEGSVKDQNDGRSSHAVSNGKRSAYSQQNGAAVTYSTPNTTDNDDSKPSTQRQAPNEAMLKKHAGRPANAVGGAMVGGLQNKRVTILSINGRGFHSQVNITSPSTVGGPTSRLTELVNDFAHANRGVIDAFHGDHFVISFNAAKSNAEGPIKAANCALEIANAAMMQMNNAGKNRNNNQNGRMFAMGISNGRACVGNMGSSTLKRLSIIGPVYSKAVALEKLCKRFNPINGSLEEEMNPIQCLVDAAVSSEIQHSFLLQVLGGLYGSPYTVDPNTNNGATRGGKSSSPAPHQPSGPAQVEVLYALRESLTNTQADEWLYELSSTTNAKLHDVNNAVLTYLYSVAPVANIYGNNSGSSAAVGGGSPAAAFTAINTAGAGANTHGNNTSFSKDASGGARHNSASYVKGGAHQQMSGSVTSVGDNNNRVMRFNDSVAVVGISAAMATPVLGFGGPTAAMMHPSVSPAPECPTVAAGRALRSSLKTVELEAREANLANPLFLTALAHANGLADVAMIPLVCPTAAAAAASPCLVGTSFAAAGSNAVATTPIHHPALFQSFPAAGTTVLTTMDNQQSADGGSPSSHHVAHANNNGASHGNIPPSASAASVAATVRRIRASTVLTTGFYGVE